MVKSRFEKKSVTPCSTPLLGPRQKSATPFGTARSPSPVLPISTVRRRSPSPVNTGNVNRVKHRFESGGGNYVGQGVEKYPTAAAKELSSSQQQLNSLNQTLPKTFKVASYPTPHVNNHQISSVSLTKASEIDSPSTFTTFKKTFSSFNPASSHCGPSPTFRPLRSVGSHITTTQGNISSSQRPFLAGIQEAPLQGQLSNSSNSNLKSPRFVREDFIAKSKRTLETMASPTASPSLSSGRGSQISCTSQASGSSPVKKSTMVGSIPSRFMSQEMIQDAASFLTQTLSNVSSSPPTARNRNLSAGSIPSSTTSSTTSPHLSHTPKFIRGPFGYTDL